MDKSIHSPESTVFTERLKMLRKKRGLNQRQLANKLNVPHNTVARIELGERRVDVLEYIQILDALETNAEKEFTSLLHEVRLPLSKSANYNLPNGAAVSFRVKKRNMKRNT